MGARRHGQEGALVSSGNVVKCFVHCKTLSRRFIYALFLQPVVGFWRLRPETLTGALSLGPRWGTFVLRPLICPPLEKILRATMV